MADTDSTSNVPQKTCTKCGQDFPATREYFFYRKDKPEGQCKTCHAAMRGHIRKEKLPDGYKRCYTCKQVLPATRDYFHFRDAKRGIFISSCKECHNAHLRSKYVWKPARIFKTEEEKKARKAKTDKEYREKNKEKVSLKMREWVSKNRVKVNQKGNEWRKKHPEHAKARKAKRRAREKSAVGSHTAQDITVQFKSQKGKCWWCGKKLNDKWHCDHLIPLARGGTNDPNNIVISCPKCNLSRADKMPWEWSDRLL